MPVHFCVIQAHVGYLQDRPVLPDMGEPAYELIRKARLEKASKLEVLDGRILRCEPDPAAPFGQTWLLEDP